MALINLINQNKEQIISIIHKFGATNPRVFGSVARMEDNQNSDIDFLVDWEKPHSLLDRIRMTHELEDLVGRKTDVVVAKNLHWYIKEDVLKEALPI